MLPIRSAVEPGRLLHVIADSEESFDRRLDLTEPSLWLQVAILRIAAGRKVAAHMHVPRERRIEMAAPVTQECWIVLRGQLRVCLYDLDQRLLHEQALHAGHVLVTFHGGHALEGVSGDTLMIECKNGPYQGRDYTAF